MKTDQKFMDKQRQPKVKGTENKKGIMDPAQNTGFTAVANRITPYDPEELDAEKDTI